MFAQDGKLQFKTSVSLCAGAVLLQREIPEHVNIEVAKVGSFYMEFVASQMSSLRAILCTASSLTL